MLSRVANSIYWMSRYIERAENVARFIQVNLNLMLEMPLGEWEQWEPLVITSGDEEDFNKRYPAHTKENVLGFLTYDLENPNSILSTLSSVRENARSIREVITSEMWEQINNFYLMVKDASENGSSSETPEDFYSRVIHESHLFAGISDATMNRGEDWHFARLGRLIERADKTSRIIDVKYYILLPGPEYVGTPIDNMEWAALLKSASALDMYRKKFHRISPENVTEFLILDRDFPRSILYCIIRSEQSLHAITGSPIGTFQNEAERMLGRVHAELNYAMIDEIILDGLHEYLDNFQNDLNLVDDSIADTFFSMRPLAQTQTQATGGNE